MAACSFGASGVKVSSLNLSSTRSKLSAVQPVHGLLMTNKKLVQFAGLGISLRPKKALTGCQASCSEAIVTWEWDKAPEDTRSPADAMFPAAASKPVPNSFQVESLLTDILDADSIAEFELKLGGFQLYVKRNLTQEIATLPAPASVSTAIELPNTNGSASSTSLAITKHEPAPRDVQTLLGKAADDGIAIIHSPKVGYFRRSRTINGNHTPPSCKEEQQVREGQVLCYIEQVGGQVPVLSNISGEVIRILREDGDAVGYGDALIAILPSFPGIKKLLNP